MIKYTMLYKTLLIFLFTIQTTRAFSQPSETQASEDHIYTIDVSQSQFTVYAFRGGLFGRFGHNHTIRVQDFDGAVTLAGGSIDQADLQVTARAASLKPIDDVEEEERLEVETTMKEKVLEVDTYPEISFRSTAISASSREAGVYEATVNGNLSLHGVTRRINMKARVTIMADTLRAFGDFELKQKDYKIEPVTAVGGLVKVKNELKIEFDFVALRQGQ